MRGLIYFSIFITFIAIIALTRHYALKKELRKITTQLRQFHSGKTNKKIDIALIDQSIEELGTELNHFIDFYVAEKRKRIQFEIEQRQAIANISHDLRTPLTSIIGYIQMVESSDNLDQEQRELLSIATDRAKRLETLINDFLNLTIIESEDPKKWERINLGEVLIEVLMSFYDRFQEKNVKPYIHDVPKELFVIANESYVKRVIENLLSNALRHGEGNIMIFLVQENHFAKLIIKNDTHNLTEEDVHRLFDRFFMADQARSGKSTGLGLSIVKSLMEKMNGTVTAQLNSDQLQIECIWTIDKMSKHL